MRFFVFLLALLTPSLHAQTPKFRPQTIDSAIKIGYGLAIADVQGDGKPDILLADKTQIVWYQNPTWQKHVIAENLTEKDNVCIAARDLDGDGKCEIAVGAGWNPSDTETSGAIFYLIPPANGDRTQKWEPIQLPHEPTTHRMKWVQRGKDRFDLVVVPLHGRGNKNGEGIGVKILAYQKPTNPRDEWKTEVISNDMHLTHNFDVPSALNHYENLLLGGREGLRLLDANRTWSISPEASFSHSTSEAFKGVGEIRLGRRRGIPFVATIEPMHGNEVVLYHLPASTPDQRQQYSNRTVIDTTLADGHALATADLLNLGHDQIIVGWRAMSNRLAKVGIKMFVAKDSDGREWETHLIDDNTMACEDLLIADLNNDNKPDIIASGRRTQNVIIYWNESN